MTAVLHMISAVLLDLGSFTYDLGSFTYDLGSFTYDLGSFTCPQAADPITRVRFEVLHFRLHLGHTLGYT